LSARDDKRAQNQGMARSANERLQDVAGRATGEGQVIPFLCECADAACLGRVEITIDDYFVAHLDRHHFVIMSGHPRIDGQTMVTDHGHYEVVRKAA
jgi:hypothetical protein